MTQLESFILAIDQSTSATKTMLFNHDAGLVERVSVPHRQFYPQNGWVEHDPEEIFSNVLEGIRQLVDRTGISESQINSIAITNQRETAMIWDRTTGKPVHNAIVWQCQRGVETCDRLKKEKKGPMIREITGLIIDP